MARMYPLNLNNYNATVSEQRMFNALRDQLDDSIEVFYSISWNEGDQQGQRTEMSEADFVLVDPRYGFLVIEVKGGKSIQIVDNEWYLEEGNQETRKLKRSPYEQAENNMRYFVNYYKRQYNFPYEGVYGAVVAYPMFSIQDVELISNRDASLTVDYNAIQHLSDSIKKAFLYWKGKTGVFFSKTQYENLVKLLKKRIAISASAGALIEDRQKQLQIINVVQDNYVYFLKNYKQFLIEGGAGTGKTWIAMKIANQFSMEGKRVLFVSYSPHLVSYVKQQMNVESIDVYDFRAFLAKYSNIAEAGTIDYKKITINIKDRYDSIVIDEGQDFSEDDAIVLRCFLRDQKDSNLCVFFDRTQNIYQRDFGDAFDIKYPIFCLRENLRNTSSIYGYAQKNTKYGKDVITNMVSGPEPERKYFSTQNQLLSYLESIMIELIEREFVPLNYITILIDDPIYDEFSNMDFVGRWNTVHHTRAESALSVYKTSAYKGLESNVVVYIRHSDSKDDYNYVAFTRAKFYLYDLILRRGALHD